MKLPGNNLRSYKYLLVIFIFGMIVFPDLAISKIDNTKEPILLIADEIHFDEKLGIIAAKGNVEIAYKKRTLTANQITYNQRDDIVTAIGNIVLVEPTGEVSLPNWNGIAIPRDSEGINAATAELFGPNSMLVSALQKRP